VFPWRKSCVFVLIAARLSCRVRTHEEVETLSRYNVAVEIVLRAYVCVMSNGNTSMLFRRRAFWSKKQPLKAEGTKRLLRQDFRLFVDFRPIISRQQARASEPHVELTTFCDCLYVCLSAGSEADRQRNTES